MHLKQMHTWHMAPTIAAVDELSAPPDRGSKKPAAPHRLHTCVNMISSLTVKHSGIVLFTCSTVTVQHHNARHVRRQYNSFTTPLCSLAQQLLLRRIHIEQQR